MTARAAEMTRLEETLRRRFRVVETPITAGAHRIDLLHPASAEELISEADFDRDERLPYWADLWPSARILAEELAVMRLRGQRVLELGCGLGLVAIVADPGRIALQEFLDECSRLGLAHESDPRPFVDGEIRQTVTLWRLRWRA